MRESAVSSEQSVGDSNDEDGSATQAFAAKEQSSRDAESARAEHTGQIGTTVSRYVVLERVGMGGVGKVLRAYDPRLQREVAVKLLRVNALSPEASARLVNEARAMAKVSHPNVVPVYDVETLSDGQIVLVMQYVAGDTLRSWSRRAHPWREVVDTLVAAGRGLVAAHTAGILHRDFKPANVLLSDDGRVKVTDFGLAKTTASTMSMPTGEGIVAPVPEPPETETKAGVVLGTPRYMAPEQHAGSELSPAADQYAFCVTLWEALTGKPPFTGVGLSKRKYGGPPPWPGEGVPRHIVDALERGMAPAADARWPSMEALLQALEHDPAKRRRAALALLGVGALVVSTGVFGWKAYSAEAPAVCVSGRGELEAAWGDVRRAETKSALLADDSAYTRRLWTRTESRLDAYSEAWVEGYEEACRATSVQGVQSEVVLDLRMACLRSVELDLRAVTGVLANADGDVRQHVDAVLDGLPPVEGCADIERMRSEVEPPLSADADRVRRARTLLAEAAAERNAGLFEPALGRVRESEVTLVGVDYVPVRAELHLERGKVLDALGRYEDAVQPLQEAARLSAAVDRRAQLRDATTRLMFVLGKRLARFDEALALRPIVEGLAQGHPLEEADVANTLALVLVEKGDIQDAESEQRKSFRLRLGALGPAHPSLANSHHSLALVLTAQSRHAEAQREHEKAMGIWEAALGPEHPNVSMSMVNVATEYFNQGMYDESEAAHRQALSLRTAALGAEHPEVLHARVNFALALCRQGQWKVCDGELEATLTLQERVLGPEHRALARTHINLAVSKQAQGLFDDVGLHLQRGLEISEATLGPDHHDTAVARINIANNLARQGKHAEAASAYRKALVTLERTQGKHHSSVATACNNLAAMLEQQAQFSDAEHFYRRALTIRLETLGEAHPQIATVRTALARVLLERGEAQEAVRLAERAWANADRAAPLTWGEAAFILAKATVLAAPSSESRARAKTLLVSAREGYSEAEAEDDLELVEAWARRNKI
ncbi:MAG: tetratricopeptide repeat protein [Nannocystales bacterium]